MLTIRPRPLQQGHERLNHGHLADHVHLELLSQRFDRHNSKGPGTAIPALFTSPAIPSSPTASPIVLAAAAIWAGSVTSISQRRQPPDAAARSCSAAGEERTPAKTRKPRLSNSIADARPMPVEAPVITTAAPGFVVIPSSRFIFVTRPLNHPPLKPY